MKGQRIEVFPAPRNAGVVEAWWSVLRRRWPVGLGLFALVAGLAAALVLTAQPVWRAEAAMRLGAPASLGGVSLGGGGPAGLFTLFQQMSGDPFANELELLSSRTVVEGVVSDNALNVALHAPRGWYRDSLLAHLSASRSTVEAAYEVSWRPDGRVEVRRSAPTDSLVGIFAPGVPAAFGGVTVGFQPRRPGMPEEFELKTLPFGEAVRITAGRLRAERKRRDANLVRIDYDDPDPGLALAVVSSAMARFTALRAELQRRESGETTDSLRAVAEQTLAELRRQEEGLASFQRESGLVAPEAQSGAVVERQADVLAALAKARGELAGTDDVLRRLAATPDPGRAWASLVAHPTFLENQTLGDLLGQLVELQQARLALSGRRTAEDREMQSLARQISYLDGSLRTLVQEYRDGIAQQVRLLEEEKARLDSVLASVPSATVELGRRERAVRQLSEIYLFTDQRLRQEALRGAVSFANIQVVDPPEVLFKPVWPRKKLGLAVGLLLALTFGTMVMAFAERASRGSRLEGSVATDSEPVAEESEAEDGAWR